MCVHSVAMFGIFLLAHIKNLKTSYRKVPEQPGFDDDEVPCTKGKDEPNKMENAVGAWMRNAVSANCLVDWNNGEALLDVGFAVLEVGTAMRHHGRQRRRRNR